METPAPTAALGVRQIFGSPTSRSHPPHCTAYDLPVNGILVLNSTATITLASDAIFQPFCTDVANIDPNNTSTSFVDFQTEFIGSTIPQVFIIGAMLMISWILVIILVITPRTSFVVSTGSGFMGSRSILGGTYGRNQAIGVGGRPLLQQIAALTVFISLMIATINSFNVAAGQYAHGYEDPIALTDEVVGSLEIRIIRVISETCLWLAQVQTLIRLFPRRKEKIIIMWSGFALILLDTLFSILDDFVADVSGEDINARPGNFNNVVPALSYLFHLALSLVYACSVVYYSLVKRRFAYYHAKMKNITVVALLSLMSIAVPVIFFVLDVAKPLLVGWGDYVRWVGAAAASVVVWEWVERIEALEREDGKDGILGREIFDGDEPLDSMTTMETRWPGSRRRKRRRHDDDDARRGGMRTHGTNHSVSEKTGLAFSSLVGRVAAAGRARRHGASATAQRDSNSAATSSGVSTAYMSPPVVPAPSVSPIARSDTTSAASTVYAVIHHGSDEAARMGPSPGIASMMRSGMSASPGAVEPFVATNSRSPSTVPSSRTSSAVQQHRGVTQQQPRSNLSQSLVGDVQTPSPAPPPSVPLTSSPSSARTTPPLRGSNNSSRLLSRFRRTPTEPTADLPTYVIRGGGETDGDGIIMELKPEDSPDRASPAAASGSVVLNAAGSFTAAPAPSWTPDPAVQAAHSHTNSYPSSPSPVRQSGSSPSNQRDRNSPPPPFSAGLPHSAPSSGPTTPDSAMDARAQSSSNGSRGSRRSWTNMPVVQEHEPDEQSGADAR